MNVSSFRALALSFSDTTEVAHMDRAAFRTPRRIFTTMLDREATVNVKLSPPEQSAVMREGREGI